MPSVSRIAVVSHGHPDVIAAALARLDAICAGAGVEIVDGDDVDLAVVLGGDGTTLRALHRFLGTAVPVIGINFGRVGFLSAMVPDGMEAGLARAFAGERRVIELPTLDVDVDGVEAVAI
ncbi:MAG TPA: NAD(+)/NADH kinase, partial [Gaiellaceae bacterium]|nr:NAD(+)/NADH kinase [Gaiellaceae bacterium]